MSQMDDCSPIVVKKLSTFKKIAFFLIIVIYPLVEYLEDIKKHKDIIIITCHSTTQREYFLLFGIFCFTCDECVPLPLTQIVTTVYVVWRQLFKNYILNNTLCH